LVEVVNPSEDYGSSPLKYGETAKNNRPMGGGPGRPERPVRVDEYAGRRPDGYANDGYAGRSDPSGQSNAVRAADQYGSPGSGDQHNSRSAGYGRSDSTGRSDPSQYGRTDSSAARPQQDQYGRPTPGTDQYGRQESSGGSYGRNDVSATDNHSVARQGSTGGGYKREDSKGQEYGRSGAADQYAKQDGYVRQDSYGRQDARSESPSSAGYGRQDSQVRQADSSAGRQENYTSSGRQDSYGREAGREEGYQRSGSTDQYGRSNSGYNPM
jgi:hypothetical protein